MSNATPTTLDDLNQAKKECLNPTLLNDAAKQFSFGKFVWHYSFKQPSTKNDFILVSRHANKQLNQKYSVTLPPDMAMEEYAQQDLNNKTKNEFLGYKMMRAMKVNVPDHHLIYDTHQNNFHLTLDFIDGENPQNYFSKQENGAREKMLKILKPSSQFFAPMIATARWDLKNENMLIKDDTIHHIDFDMILEESKYWDHNFKENQNKAVTLLKEYVDPITKEPRSNIGAHYFFLTKENILQSFKDAKENLNAATDQFSHSHEREILHHVHGRIGACMDYLKNRL